MSTIATAEQLPHLERLRATLSEHPPFCSGTLKLKPESFVLYYGKGKNARRIDLSGSSPDDVQALDELETACEAATFGRDQETVLDESYRKAGKMDPDNFLLGFNVERERLVQTIRAGLLTEQKEEQDIKAELYKLNMYGKDAFFKPHKDTPRGTDMFGSLVIVYPTPHDGGELVIRHEGNEWTFDAAQSLSKSYAQSGQKSIAYIAFFSDVEHEVLPVKSGHRVTVTYNLYWTTSPPVPEGLSVLFPRHANPFAMEEALSAFLADPTVLPKGGTLGFTLRHAYPFPNRWEEGMPNPLDNLANWLKGSDAALFRACQSLSLSPFLRLLNEEHHRYYTLPSLAILDHMVRLDYLYNVSETRELCTKHGGILVLDVPVDTGDLTEDEVEETLERAKIYGEMEVKSICVSWVTKDPSLNRIGAEYTAYGNEAQAAYMYTYVSLFVGVGPPGDRTNVELVDGTSWVRTLRPKVY